MTRVVLRGIIACLAGFALALPAEANTIGDSMALYLNGQIGKRVGGGECANMATEALRVGNGEFISKDLGPDSPNSGDYVWGTLVTVISCSNKVWSDSAPTVAVQVGDVIQYHSAVISGASYSHHTSVVKSVTTGTSSKASRPTAVYQQNFNKVRTVQSATIDTTKLTAGWIRIYRPIARKDANNLWKVTLVNNASTSQTVSIMISTTVVGTLSLTAANTSGSFKTYYITTDGTVPCLVLSNNQTIYLQNATSDSIYNPTSSTLAVQRLSP